MSPGPVAVADVARLPLSTASVGAALAMHMLYHVSDIARAVRELSRVVAGDGLVVVSTNSDRDKPELEDLWQRAAGDVLGTGRGRARISLSALPGTITVREPESVIAHMASYQAWADQHDVPFEETIDRAWAILGEHIAQQGAFEINCRGGILVCRR